MPEQLLILKCVRCPERYDNLITIDYCDGCEFNDFFKYGDDNIVCNYLDDGDE